MIREVIESKDVCSVVLARLFILWQQAEVGDEVVIKTPWRGAVSELEKWCNETGNSIVETKTGKNLNEIRIKFLRKLD